MLADLVDRLTTFSGPGVYLAVGAFALLETAAFAGLAVPGETAVVLGGVIAAQGRISLAGIAAAAVVGAVIGDSLGFLLGRRVGTRLLRGPFARLVGRARVDRALERLRAGGMRSVLLGRFVGVVRALMPFAAGSSGMSYPRFLAASVLGATAWGTAFTLLGYAAGSSWHRVQHYAGRASGVLALLIAVIVLIVVGARHAAARQDRIVAWWQRQLDRPRVAAGYRRYRRQITFLVNRFRPGPAAGLQLTAALVALAVLSSLLALVVSQVLDAGPLVVADRSVHDALVRSHTPFAVSAMQRVHGVLSAAGAWGAALVVGCALWLVDRRPRALVVLLLSVAGAAVLVLVVRALLSRPTSLFAPVRTTFPSADLTLVAAAIVALLVVTVPRLRRWTRRVTAVAIGAGGVVVAAVAVVYLGDLYLSDVIAGAVLGGMWALVVATVVTAAWRTPGRRWSSAPR
ncbi:MAG: VTT domain-containing protein [Mycobacteriales bacterium]|nr:VTT domain-containing protein [Frankia sp.]